LERICGGWAEGNVKFKEYFVRKCYGYLDSQQMG
jgi:hypothetical protein